MTLSIAQMAAAVAETAPDMNKAVKGGGGAYTPPAAGMVRLRLVAYVETGKHKVQITGKPDKIEDEVKLTFELSGPKHEPKVLDDGTKLPHRITLTLNRSMNEKANFYKLFKRMNYKGLATHMSQLVGEAFKGTVVHKVVGEGDDKKTYANLKDDAGYTIQPPRVDDPETGDTRDLVVAPAISPLRLFVWNTRAEFLKPMWDSLFIDGTSGEGDNARSLNVFQDRIKAATDYVGSPIYNLLQSGGVEPDLPGTSEAPPANAGSQPDPLDDIPL